MRLTIKQKLFAENFAKTGNLEQSALEAGYSKTYSRARAYDLLNNIGIANYIKELNKEAEANSIAEIKEIKQFWTSMFRDKDTDPRDRLKASEFLAKTAGAFIDNSKVELSGAVANEINIVIDGETYD